MDAQASIELCDEEVLGSRGLDLFSKGKHVIEEGATQKHNWDASAWEWDKNLFVANPRQQPSQFQKHTDTFLHASAHGFCLGYNDNGYGNARGLLGDTEGLLFENEDFSEKRRKVLGNKKETDMTGLGTSLTLKVGGSSSDNSVAVEENSKIVKNGKRPRMPGPYSQNSPHCQVDDCNAELSNAKDYHRRHKVCEFHSKANQASIGSTIQRFCQQCSRFHLLTEFDEGKRSCRRRLAGHNRRRRKTLPANLVGGINDERLSGSLLMTLLNLLAQLQNPTVSDQNGIHDVLIQLMKKLSGSSCTFDEKNAAHGGQLIVEKRYRDTKDYSSQTLEKQELNNSLVSCKGTKTSYTLPDKASGLAEIPKKFPCSSSISFQNTEETQKRFKLGESTPDFSSEKAFYPARFSSSNDLDLNNVTNGLSENVQGSDGPSTLLLLGRPHNESRQNSYSCFTSGLKVNESSPPSDNSEFGSDQSPSSSQGDDQGRTGRIVFKLFGKDPSEFPQALRLQILDWLAHSPSDMESHIRPGCVVLTIYLRLSESEWRELVTEFRSSLERLLKASSIGFWNKGWIFAQVEERVAFIFDGEILLDSFLYIEESPVILGMSPVAVAVGKPTDVVVKGLDQAHRNSKIICAFKGYYLEKEAITEYIHDVSYSLDAEHSENTRKITSQKFSWLPQQIGRCFVEVEDYNMRAAFFPLIIAEEEICTELCTLQRYIDLSIKGYQDVEEAKHDEKLKQKMEAVEFLHELGWLLERSCLSMDIAGVLQLSSFSGKRFMWLLNYAVQQDWCMVVKRIMDILFKQNMSCDVRPLKILEEIGILHIAVRKKCRAMVELLVNYVPDFVDNEHQGSAGSKINDVKSFVLKPDMDGPGGLTPLHVAASMADAEPVLDALTNDPGQVGVKAWISVKDQTGRTAKDYALLGGRYSYIELVQNKAEKIQKVDHVSVYIPEIPIQHEAIPEVAMKNQAAELNNVSIEMPTRKQWLACNFDNDNKVKVHPSYCSICDRQLHSSRSNTLLYRPALLSMLAIATVCVCVALLFKGPPEVLFVMPPFRWELVKFGPQ